MTFSKNKPVIKTSAELCEIVAVVPVSNRETWGFVNPNSIEVMPRM